MYIVAGGQVAVAGGWVTGGWGHHNRNLGLGLVGVFCGAVQGWSNLITD